MTPSPLLRAIVSAAARAGRLIMDVYETEVVARSKSDESPVTHADEGAEAILLSALAAAAPGVPVIAEEEAAAGRIPAVGERFFLVDPLDGTKEFLARNGEFTVNVARVDAGAPAIGVVFAPALGRMFAAENGRAWELALDVRALGPLEADFGAARPLAARAPSGRIRALWSRSHDKWRADEYRETYGVDDAAIVGSSIKFCLIAAGEADLYPRHGPTMEWDTAAGQAVLEGAGGSVRTLDGRRLAYGKAAEAFRNPHFVARGR